MEHTLKSYWAELKDIKGNQVLEIKFKNNVGITYKGLVKANKENIEQFLSLNEVTVTGDCKEKSYPNKYNNTITKYLQLSNDQLKNLGFIVETRAETLLKQLKQN